MSAAINSSRRAMLGSLGLMLTGCATEKMHGYQLAYQSYSVPGELVDRIRRKFTEYGLEQASVVLDGTGRVRLTGSYRNEEAVARAFIIAQSIVGLKATSPIYPEKVQVRQWELDAARALERYAERSAHLKSAPPTKRALIIGINQFLYPKIPTIQGMDDAVVMADALRQAGYKDRDMTVLVGTDATKSNVEQAVARFGSEIGINDTVFIYVSSHGTQPTPMPGKVGDRRMSIVAYDTRLGSGDGISDWLMMQDTSIKDGLIQDVARIPSKITRVVIDTCYSGDILKDVTDPRSQEFIRRSNGGLLDIAGVSIGAWTGEGFSSKAIIRGSNTPSHPSTGVIGSPRSTLFKETKPYVFITATSEGEESMGPPLSRGTFPSPLDPQRQLRGSFFTQSFLDYLRYHRGQVEPAFADARAFTMRKVQDVSKGQKTQVPRLVSTIPAQSNNLFA